MMHFMYFFSANKLHFLEKKSAKNVELITLGIWHWYTFFKKKETQEYKSRLFYEDEKKLIRNAFNGALLMEMDRYV